MNSRLDRMMRALIWCWAAAVVVIGMYLPVLGLMPPPARPHAISCSGLSPFELLIYASLFAFEHLIPGRFSSPEQNIEDEGLGMPSRI